MAEASRAQPVENGASPRGVQQPDSRDGRLYLAERRSLPPREALRLLVNSWFFIRPHRRLVALKFLLALA